MRSIVSATVSVVWTRSASIFSNNARLSGRSLNRITGLFDFRASAISDAVPAPPAPQAITTSLERTFMLLRALPIPVTIATSTASEMNDLSAPGTTPIVRPPACLTPRLTASITPMSRPPLSSTQPCYAIATPSAKAASTSSWRAFSPAPITPITARRDMLYIFPSLGTS